MSLCFISYNNTVFTQPTSIEIINKCEAVISVTLIAWSGCPAAASPGNSALIGFFVQPGTSIVVSPLYNLSPTAFWASAEATTTVNGVPAWNITTTPNPYCPALPPWNWGNSSNGLITSLWGFPPSPYFPQIVFDD